MLWSAGTNRMNALPQAREDWQTAQMMRNLITAAAFALATPALAPAIAAPALPAPVLAPVEIVAAAPAADWAAIAPADLLVMDLAPDAKATARRVVIQLVPPPFSQGWIANIRKLAAAHWWDGTSINRVQDNYAVQWGDPDGEDKAKAKPLPEGLKVVPAGAYVAPVEAALLNQIVTGSRGQEDKRSMVSLGSDQYSDAGYFENGWPIAAAWIDRSQPSSRWPTHCYGMVGVGRDYPPDTGSGAELYVVIGHAPRQLDRNIALVGRVIEGIEHLSSLPRGTGDIGFYKTAPERVPITAIRNGTDVKDLARYEYLSTESASFASYADARKNRRDAFYIRPAGGADICNIPVPVRRAK